CQHPRLRRRVSALGGFPDPGLRRGTGPAVRPHGLALDTLVASRAGAAERRPGLRRAVVGAGSVSWLVPDGFPLAVRRLQPTLRPAGWAGSAGRSLAALVYPGAHRCTADQPAAPGCTQTAAGRRPGPADRPLAARPGLAAACLDDLVWRTATGRCAAGQRAATTQVGARTAPGATGPV